MKAGMYSQDIVLSLKNIKKLAEKLNNPQKDLKIIHVAGTNGKGSVCAFLESALIYAGFRVGKFTSPEIKTVCDSIKVNGEDINKSRLLELSRFIKSKDEFSCSDFEILTLCAFTYFKEEKCDFVIIEVGLGGEGDATNIIESPLYSVICKISIDHTVFLGNTLESIAEKKAGIIKENSKTVTLHSQAPEVLNIIKNRCNKKNNCLTITSKSEALTPDDTKECFIYKGHKYKSGLSGLYQIENATLAIEVLTDLGISPNIIKEGLASAKNPARFEIMSDNPTIIFDGAHNPDGMDAFLSSLARYFPNTQKNIIIGMMKDKDADTVINLFKKYSEDKLSKIYTVNVDNPRAENPEILKQKFSDAGFSAECSYTVRQALSEAEKNRITIVCGSLYLHKDISL